MHVTVRFPEYLSPKCYYSFLQFLTSFAKILNTYMILLVSVALPPSDLGSYVSILTA